MMLARQVMKVLDIPRSGKRGNRVWQRNRYCQYSYPVFVPFNPRTPAQTAVRAHFGAVSARWRLLTEAQRRVWMAVASTKKTRPRLLQCGRMPGFNFFMKTNVALANRGLAQVDLPLEFLRALEAEAANRRSAPSCSCAPSCSWRRGGTTPRGSWPVCWPGPAEGRLIHSKFRHLASAGSREVCLTATLFPLISVFCLLPSVFPYRGFPGSPRSRLFWGWRA
jgi:hypothetical protein